MTRERWNRTPRREQPPDGAWDPAQDPDGRLSEPVPRSRAAKVIMLVAAAVLMTAFVILFCAYGARLVEQLRTL